MNQPAIFAEGLRKSYGDVHALKGIDLAVPPGTILGLLGPNGAGKTTAVRILATLLRPDAGRATVAGYDVVRQAADLRTVIGLSGQFAAVDENLTGRENLRLVGFLYHLGVRESGSRADELLRTFDLVEAADRPAKTYSGGMRRRLDLAASLVARPRVLFLDEPTTGLDPRSRLGMWGVIAGVVADGTTILLTTQYLEEADQLADRIAVIDSGLVIAEGTADELKTRLGADVIDVRLADGSAMGEAFELLRSVATSEPKIEPHVNRITLPVGDGASVLSEVVRRIDGAGITISELSLHRPSLDDVFLELTGRRAADDEAGEADAEEAAEGDADGTGATAVAGDGRRSWRSFGRRGRKAA
jgi:ABC-2 type transport system ATP-binding protein